MRNRRIPSRFELDDGCWKMRTAASLLLFLSFLVNPASAQSGNDSPLLQQNPTLTAYGYMSREGYVPDESRALVRDIGLAGPTSSFFAIQNGSFSVWGDNVYYAQAFMPANLGVDVPVRKVSVYPPVWWALLKNGTLTSWSVPGAEPWFGAIEGVADVVSYGRFLTILYTNGSVSAYPAEAQNIPEDVQGQVQSLSLMSWFGSERPLLFLNSTGRINFTGPTANEYSPAILAVLKNGSVVDWAVDPTKARFPLFPDFSGLDVGSIQARDNHILLSLRNGTMLSWAAKDHYFSLGPANSTDTYFIAVLERVTSLGCDPATLPGKNAYVCVRAFLTPLPETDSTDIVDKAVLDRLVYLTYRNGSVAVWEMDGGYFYNATGEKLSKEAAGYVAKIVPDYDYVLYLLTTGQTYADGSVLGPAYVPSGFRQSTVQVAASEDIVAMLSSTGQVFVYGRQRREAVQVLPDAARDVVSVAVGGRRVVILNRNGSVVIWDGLTGLIPVPVITQLRTAAIAADYITAYAVLKDTGQLISWDLWTAGNVVEPGLFPSANVSQVAGDSSEPGALLLLRNGSVVSTTGTDVPQGATKDVVHVSTSVALSAAVKKNGTVLVWLSRPDQTQNSSHVSVDLFPTATKVAACTDSVKLRVQLFVVLNNNTMMNATFPITQLSQVGNMSYWNVYQPTEAVQDVICTTSAVLVIEQDVAPKPTSQLIPQVPTTSLEPGSSQGRASTKLSVTAVSVIVASVVVILIAALLSYVLVVRRRRRMTGPDVDIKSEQVECIVKLADGSSDVSGCMQQHMKPQKMQDGPWTADQDGTSHIPPTAVPSAQQPLLQVLNLDGREVFMRATALSYAWGATPKVSFPVEAGINDWQLDQQLLGVASGQAGLVHTPNLHDLQSGPRCPVIHLSREQLQEDIVLCQDGLLGRGATALVFKCLWPKRFGPTAVLAAKVLRDGYEPDEGILEAFKYEAGVLEAAVHPNIVRLYGVCLQPPNVCLILELLPCSLKQLIHSPDNARSLISSHQANQQHSCTPSSMMTTSEHTARASTYSIQNAVVSSTVQQPGEVACGNYGSLGTVNSGIPPTSTNESTRSVDSDTITWTDGASRVQLLLDEPSNCTSADVNIGTRLSLGLVTRISLDISAALAFLHTPNLMAAKDFEAFLPDASLQAQGDREHVLRIAHRDVKPANVLINSQGVAKISDFGLARRHENTTLHTVHQAAGTLPYMAPELLACLNTHDALPPTNKVDIYSLGMLMWEMLSSRQPWHGLSQVELRAKVIHGNRPELPKLPMQTAEASPSATHTLSACHADLHRIITVCWQKWAHKRPTAAQVHKMILEVSRKYSDVLQHPGM